MTIQQARKIQEHAMENLAHLSTGDQAMWTLIQHLERRLAITERELDERKAAA